MARTWGQIRLELTKALPGIDIELLTGFIQSTYQGLLDSRPWGGLRLRTTLQLPAVYGNGLTVSVTQGSTVVNAGTGVTFTTAMNGWLGSFDATPAIYTMTYVSASQMTLDRGYQDATDTVATFILGQVILPLPSDCKYIEQIENPYLCLPMEKKTRSELEDIQAAGLMYNQPSYWAPDDDSVESAPPVLHNVRVWPAAMQAIGLPMTYQKAATAFDGTNTLSYPLPWVSDDAIIYGAKGMALEYLKDYDGADRANARFAFFLGRMQATETEREGPVKLRMASRFTRHRIMRWSRFPLGPATPSTSGT